MKRNEEPIIYHDPMAQRNGSTIVDVPTDAPAVADDPVNHPSHYTFGSIEVIDVIEGLRLPYHLGNAVKYIARAGKKDPAKTVEDLRKAVWYINRYISLLEKQGTKGERI